MLAALGAAMVTVLLQQRFPNVALETIIPHEILDWAVRSSQQRWMDKEFAPFRQTVWLSSFLIPTWFQIHSLLFLVQVILHHLPNIWAVMAVLTLNAGWGCYKLGRQSSTAVIDSMRASTYWILLYVSAWTAALVPSTKTTSMEASVVYQHFQLDFPWSLAHFTVATGVIMWELYRDESQRERASGNEGARQVLPECIQRATDDVRALIGDKIHKSRSKDNELEVALMRWVLVDSWRPTDSSPTAGRQKDTSPPIEAPGTNGTLDFWRSLCDTSLNETAQPAVTAYTEAIEGFPPDRDLSMVVSVITQCPATLACLQVVSWEYARGQSVGLVNPWWTILCLVPFVALDAWTIRHWIVSCHKMTNYRRRRLDHGDRNPGTANEPTDGALSVSAFWEDTIDSMVLLLSPSIDLSNRSDTIIPPTALLVWWNIVDSVEALERTMKTARCIQSTAVAVDLTHNLHSLVDFGVQVQEKGWLHGLGLLLQEVIVSMDESMLRNEDEERTQYIDAASSAVRNSQIMFQNVKALQN
mmetsp:Transcript_14660/g.33164  ORF Transcript_14660/g.33164 Transcript_14660/m.33164 type:complete len:528 (-) Transcript_14660:270-1853(-)